MKPFPVSAFGLATPSAWGDMRHEIYKGVTLTPSLRAYVETMLWSSTHGEEGEPMDESFSIRDLSREALEQSARELADFIADAEEADLFHDDDMANPEHDFWLTRNRHGAGFWDGDYKYGDALTGLAHTYGEVYPYVGDDGEVHLS